ncbi:MAG: hypothetical protein ACU4EP_00325 [Candidatus Nitrosoglobus sp.]|jgi:hypothetical protein
MYDEHQSMDVGYAINSLRPTFTTRGVFNRIFGTLEVDLAVRDTDAFIFRAGYYLILADAIIKVEHLVRVPNISNAGRTFEIVCNTAKAQLQAVGLREQCARLPHCRLLCVLLLQFITTPLLDPQDNQGSYNKM